MKPKQSNNRNRNEKILKIYIFQVLNIQTNIGFVNLSFSYLCLNWKMYIEVLITSFLFY